MQVVSGHRYTVFKFNAASTITTIGQRVGASWATTVTHTAFNLMLFTLAITYHKFVALTATVRIHQNFIAGRHPFDKRLNHFNLFS
jgi:hypothetical protein